MSINGKYPEQLIAMVSKDMKAAIVAESDRREISISQLVREKIETADANAKPFCDQCAGPYPESWLKQYGGHWDTCPNRKTPLDPEPGYPYGDLDPDDLLDKIKAGEIDGAETLAAYARNLAPDTEPDEVDGSLSDHEARVARLRARGLG